MKKFSVFMMFFIVLSLSACSGDPAFTGEPEHHEEYHEGYHKGYQEDGSRDDHTSKDLHTVTYDVLLYEDDTVSITLAAVETDNIIFCITNKSEEINDISCEFVTLDDQTFREEDTDYSIPFVEFNPGETKEYRFCEWGWWNDSGFMIENTDCETISARFEYCTESQDAYKFVDTGRVNLK